MRAVLSGRAAVAILNEGDSWHSMTYEESELLMPCHAAQAKTLLRNAHDLIWLEDVSVEDVRDRLADVVDSTEALDCVLYLLDGRLQPETRDAVALEFEELAAWPEIVEEVESVLLARPLPASADLDGAIAACERMDARAATQLFRHWHSLQPTVQAVYDAWLQIPVARFGDTTQQTVAQGHFIKHGIFAALVRTDLQPSPLTTFQFSSSANAQLKHDVPGAVGVINDWLRILKGQRHFVDHVAVAEYADFCFDSEVEQRAPKHRRSFDRTEVKHNVDKQKRLIVDAIRSNDSQRAKRIAEELIQYQLANDGKRLVGKSLCALAMDAQQFGHSQMQHWLTARAVECVPDDSWSWAQHGKSLLNLRQFVDAETAFRNAVDFGDGETIPVAKTGRAEVLKAQGKLPEALVAFDEVIAAHPGDVVAKTGRAEVLKAQGKLPEALVAFDKVIATHPEHVVAKNGRVTVLVLMGQWDAALAELPNTEPHTLEEWIQYHIGGMIAFRKNDLVTAEAVFERGGFECPFADQQSFFETALAMVRLSQDRLEDVRKLAERNLEGRWQAPMTAVLVHIKGRMGEIESARESFQKLPTPPNLSVAEAFAELRLRYVLCQPAEHDEEWLISREINYLLSC